MTDTHVQQSLSLPHASAHKETLRLRAYAALAIGDAIALAIAFLGANLFYAGRLDSQHGVGILSAVLPIYLLLAAYNKAYGGATLEQPRIGIANAIQSFLWTAGVVLLIAYLLKAGDQFSRIVFTIGSLTSIVALAGIRVMLARPLLRMLGGTPFTTIVIRDGIDYAPGRYEKVVTPEQIGFDPETQDPYLYHLFATSIDAADKLVIACPQARYPLWSAILKSLSVDGEILTDEHDRLGILGIGRHGERQTLVVSVEPLHMRQRLFKRLFDLAFATVALIMLSPIFLVAAIAIRLETPGPVFFRQDRIGRDNRIFRMFKFRSMHSAASDHAASQLTRRGDSRVTRVGAFIRKHSIDELPQLINVLNGTMSVVGPRPHPIAAKAGELLYWHADDRYRFRHSIKPGLTGLAQVRGFRGSTDRVEDLTNRLTSDLEYLAHWSISRDIWIIFRTFGVLSHSNAF